MFGIIGGYLFLFIDEAILMFSDQPSLTPVCIGYLLFLLGGWTLKRDGQVLDPGIRYALISALCSFLCLIEYVFYARQSIIPIMMKIVALPIASTLMLHHVGKGLINLENHYGCDWYGKWIWFISIYANLSFTGIYFTIFPLFIFVIANCIIAWIFMSICIILIIQFWWKLCQKKKLGQIL